MTAVDPRLFEISPSPQDLLEEARVGANLLGGEIRGAGAGAATPRESPAELADDALVDFTSAWCPPCRAIAPHVQALATCHAGRLRVGTCDVDSNNGLVARLDVRAMPTLMVFKGGRVVGQIVGAVPRARLDALVARAL